MSFKFIGVMFFLKTSVVGGCSCILGPPSEVASFEGSVSAPSEVAADGGKEGLEINGEIGGVVSLCNNSAIFDGPPWHQKSIASIFVEHGWI